MFCEKCGKEKHMNNMFKIILLLITLLIEGTLAGIFLPTLVAAELYDRSDAIIYDISGKSGAGMAQQFNENTERLDDTFRTLLWLGENKGRGADSPEELMDALFKATFTGEMEKLEKYWDAGADDPNCQYKNDDNMNDMCDTLYGDIVDYKITHITDYKYDNYSSIWDAGDYKGTVYQFTIYSDNLKYGEVLLPSFYNCHTNRTPDGEKWFLGRISER